MPDFDCELVDSRSREVIEVARFTAPDPEALRARLSALHPPDGVQWGEVRPARTRLFAFGVTYVVEAEDATSALEGAMAEYLNGTMPDDISFEHIAGPFEFRAELRGRVDAPVVLAGTHSTLARSAEVDEP